MAKQLLAETVISEMEQEIEKMHVERTAVRRVAHNEDETEESLSAAGQEVLQRPLPFDAAAQGSDHNDFTSNDDTVRSSIQASTFDSVYISASGQQFESSNSTAPTSDNRKLEADVNIADSAVSNKGSLTFSKGNAQQRPDIMLRRTAMAILNSLVPGLNWNVTKNFGVTVESPWKEFVVSINVDGEYFEGCSRAIYLARHYAAEAALNKLFGMEFRRDVGMPLFHGKLAEVAHLKKGKLNNARFLDVHGKNAIVTLNKLFKDEVSFQFNSPLASERGFRQCCTVSVAGLTFEGCDSFRKNAKKRAALAAVAVLRANRMYDQKVAELKARPTGRVFSESRFTFQPEEMDLKNSKFLDIHGKNAVITLNRLFKDEASFRFRSSLASESGFKHYCTVSVAGMTFESCDSFRKIAKKLAAFAAVSVLRANRMYDQKVAELKARPTGVPVQQMMVKQRAPSSAIGVRSIPVARTKSQPLPVSAISRLRRAFPESKFTSKAEEMDFKKGKIITIDLLIGDQTFVGRGRKLRSARVDASKKALRAFGLRSDIDEEAQAQLHVPPEMKKKLHEKQLARGRGKGSAVHGSRRNYDYLSVNSSYFGTENFGSSYFGHSDSQGRGISERRSYKNNYIPADVNFYDPRDKQASFMGSEIKRGNDGGNDMVTGGNHYSTGNSQARFLGSGVERGYNKNSDSLIGGNYYGAGNKQARFMDSGVERGRYNKNSDVLIDGNYYGTGDEQVIFMGSGIKRRNDNSNDNLIGSNFYDTDDRHASFVDSGVRRFAGRNEGVPSVNRNISSRLLNVACGAYTRSSASDFGTAYQNNEYE